MSKAIIKKFLYNFLFYKCLAWFWVDYNSNKPLPNYWQLKVKAINHQAYISNAEPLVLWKLAGGWLDAV